jgi:hypothetical protein
MVWYRIQIYMLHYALHAGACVPFLKKDSFTRSCTAAKTKKIQWQCEILDISTWTTHMHIPTPVNCHKCNSPLTMSAEPTISHQDQEDTREDEDEERESL